MGKIKDKLIEHGEDIAKGAAISPGLPVIGLGAVKLRKKILEIAKKLKKSKTQEDKDFFKNLLTELKSEQKLAQGDRGAAEQMPKKAADKNLRNAAMRRMIEHLNEHGFQGKQGRVPMGPGSIYDYPMNLKKKGGKIKSKYSKGGGVRPAKYKI